MNRRPMRSSPGTRSPSLARELARLRQVEHVALEFCARCERGEIRSSATYESFRAALAGGAGDPPRAPGFSWVGSCARSGD